MVKVSYDKNKKKFRRLMLVYDFNQKKVNNKQQRTLKQKIFYKKNLQMSLIVHDDFQLN